MYIRFSNGENKVKKIIHIIGIISLLIIVALNLVFTATLDVSEKITINFIYNFNNDIHINNILHY